MATRNVAQPAPLLRVLPNRHQRTVPHAAAAIAEAAPAVEMKDVMDASLGAIDRTVYDLLKTHAPVSWHLSSFSVRRCFLDSDIHF